MSDKDDAGVWQCPNCGEEWANDSAQWADEPTDKCARCANDFV